MKKLIASAAAALVLLAGCAHFRGDVFGDATRPQIVDSGKRDASGIPIFSVSPAVLSFLPEQRNVRIVWSLPSQSKLRFAPGNGIVIDGELKDTVQRETSDGASRQQTGATRQILDPRQREIIDCQGSSDGLTFSCLNVHSRPSVFKYSVHLIEGNERYVLDPVGVNW